jgi:hypothetical protein
VICGADVLCAVYWGMTAHIHTPKRTCAYAIYTKVSLIISCDTWCRCVVCSVLGHDSSHPHTKPDIRMMLFNGVAKNQERDVIRGVKICVVHCVLRVLGKNGS